ncbi:MAG TPA: SDR family oxidoreductase [Gemmatimonadales bacterium]|nr:SDR family oxidoreductase [Gemmatimonadales bacterium]
MALDLTGKVALVTGGARRLGRALSEALADHGATVAIHHHSSAGAAQELIAAIKARGKPEPQAFRADLRDGRQAGELPRQVAARMGRLDIVVNSAAVMTRQPFGSVTAEMWDSVLDLNLRAYFLVAQGAASALRAARGRIVNISDVAAFDAWPSFLPHCVSKAGVEMLTRGLARVLAPDVTVNGIAPGPVLPPDDADPAEHERLLTTIPLKRMGSPADVVRALLYLLMADFVTGTTLIVDGGQLVRGRGRA